MDPWNPSNEELYVAQKCQTTDFRLQNSEMFGRGLYRNKEAKKV